jgi:hypothetical protein
MARFEILSGLPAYGPAAEPFSPTGQGEHREGFVVRFAPDTDSEWVGNFQPGAGGLSNVYEHPNGAELIVVAGGQGYVVAPDSRRCVATFGATIESAFNMPECKVIIFGNGLWFEAIGTGGPFWRSGRISWDGMRDVTIDGSKLTGNAWDISGDWVPFQLDVTSGNFTGGSYNGPDRPKQ